VPLERRGTVRTEGYRQREGVPSVRRGTVREKGYRYRGGVLLENEKFILSNPDGVLTVVCS
jgi:hypothetical protein